MKAEILKENLKKGLNIVERITTKNLSLPILENICLETEDNSLISFSATDLETAIKTWSLAKIIKKGKVVVPAKIFSQLVSLLPDEKIFLEEKKQGLYLECLGFKNYIQGFNPDDFPIFPSIESEKNLEIDSQKFCQGLNQVVDIASPSTSKPEISGIFLSFSKNIIKLVSTDSFRLAEKTIILDDFLEKDFSFILPQKSVKEIINIFSENEGKIKIYISPTQVFFESIMKEINHSEVYLMARLIEGEYPNYQEIIPQKFKNRILLSRDEFISQLKTASLFTGKINEVKIFINSKNKKLEISAQDLNIGEFQSYINAKIEGSETKISFNYKFLLDGLLNIKSSEIIFEISKEDGPCILKPVGDESYFYVVMPIKSS